MKSKILIIDDEVSICRLLDNSLKENYDVTVKHNGKDALDWLEENIPHLVICDIQMPPGMDGYAVLQSIRERGYTMHTPVIMLSGVESSKERIKCYQLGAQDFLMKPFNIFELLEIIKKNLNPIYYSIKW